MCAKECQWWRVFIQWKETIKQIKIQISFSFGMECILQVTLCRQFVLITYLAYFLSLLQ